MIFGEILLIIILWGVPVLLIYTVWKRFYLARRSAEAITQFSITLPLGLFSLSGALWVVVYGLVLFDEHSKLARAVVDRLPSGLTLVVVNLPMCLGALLSALSISTSEQITGALRKALVIGSAFMCGVWLFALISLH